MKDKGAGWSTTGALTILVVMSLLLFGLGGCGGSGTQLSAEEACGRSGGVWHGTFCERAAGGGY